MTFNLDKALKNQELSISNGILVMPLKLISIEMDESKDDDYNVSVKVNHIWQYPDKILEFHFNKKGKMKPPGGLQLHNRL